MADNLSKLVEKLNHLGVEDNRIPPVEKWDPPLSGDIDIRIDASGRWFHEGSEIRREALVKLFSTILKREGDDYFLVTPVEKWRLTVEDVPFLVTAVERVEEGGDRALVFRTSVGDRVILSGANPLRITQTEEGEPRPYLLVRHGMEGLLARPVYYQLMDYLETGANGNESVHGVYSLGEFFPLE